MLPAREGKVFRDLPEPILRAIRSGPVPTLRDWRNLPTSELTRAERNMRFVETYCIVPEGKLVGKPLVLADFQEAFYYAVYDNKVMTREAFLGISRKNSKTATIATIVLVHVVGPEARVNSEIMSGARSRDQAAQVYRYASKMVAMSDELSQCVRVVPSAKRLIGLPRNVEYRAGSADATTSHGGSPVLAILDELGQIEGPQDDYVDAIITSQGAHEDPLLIGISTQAPTDAALWSVWLDDAEKEQDKHGGTIVCHLYETPDDFDLQDREGWLLSNPALGIFRMEEDMVRLANKAARMPSFEPTFRNLYLNQRIAATATFVSPNVWKENGADPGRMDVIYAGLDLSETNDLTALVMVSPSATEGWSVKSVFWLPGEGLEHRSRSDRVPYDVWRSQGHLNTTPGRSIEYEYVAQYLFELVRGGGVKKIAFDRYNMRHLRPWLVKAGLPESVIDSVFVDYGQGFVSMSPALRTLESLLLNGKIRHGNNPILTMCAANAVVTMDPAGNRKLDKKKARGRIDGMVALAMACAVASEDQNDTPVFPVDLERILE